MGSNSQAYRPLVMPSLSGTLIDWWALGVGGAGVALRLGAVVVEAARARKKDVGLALPGVMVMVIGDGVHYPMSTLHVVRTRLHRYNREWASLWLS
jgi:hypothetical protein